MEVVLGDGKTVSLRGRWDSIRGKAGPWVELGRASGRCSSQESLQDNKGSHFLVFQHGWDSGWVGQWLGRTVACSDLL